MKNEKQQLYNLLIPVSSGKGARPKVVVTLPQTQKNVSGQVVGQTLRQTQITDHASMQPLPPHIYQQMYAGNKFFQTKVMKSAVIRWLLTMQA